MSSVRFSLSLFNHPGRLARFMNGEEALDEIAEISKKSSPKKPLYFGRWSVLWIKLKSPFEWIFACFTKAMAWLSWCFGCICISRFFTVLTRQMRRDHDQVDHQARFREKLLIPSINAHQLGSWDIYRNGKIPLSKIQNPEILNMTPLRSFCDQITKELSSKDREMFFKLMLAGKKEEARQLLPNDLRAKFEKDFSKENMKIMSSLRFFQKKGLCLGGTLWFIHLFMKSIGKFQNPKIHAMAVAEQFKTGIPSQAALLQVFSGFGDFLEEKATLLEKYTIATEELDHEKMAALKKIRDLPVGLYKVNVYNHAFAYYKDEKVGYVWNSIFGLLELTPDEVLEMIYSSHYVPKHERSEVSFEQFMGQEKIDEVAI